MSDSTGLTVDLSRPEWEDAPDTLVSLLAGHDSGPVVFDGSRCRALPTQLLQIVLSACRTFTPRGVPVRLDGATPALVRGLAALGLTDAIPGAGAEDIA